MIEPEALTTDMLAELFDVEPSTIKKLAKGNIITKLAPELYATQSSITGYITHLRKIAAGRSENIDAKASSLKSGAKLRAAQTKLVEARTEKELGNLMPSDLFLKGVQSIVGNFRGAMLELPDLIVHRLNLPHSDHDKLEKLIDEKLTELAEREIVKHAAIDLGYIDPKDLEGVV